MAAPALTGVQLNTASPPTTPDSPDPKQVTEISEVGKEVKVKVTFPSSEKAREYSQSVKHMHGASLATWSSGSLEVSLSIPKKCRVENEGTQIIFSSPQEAKTWLACTYLGSCFGCRARTLTLTDPNAEPEEGKAPEGKAREEKTAESTTSVVEVQSNVVTRQQTRVRQSETEKTRSRFRRILRKEPNHAGINEKNASQQQSKSQSKASESEENGNVSVVQQQTSSSFSSVRRLVQKKRH
ncbi:hypothetical protein B0T21DRAFT_345001 [Apiosordaria backusii]|uniref:Uncharacterized protein n=1 Tax=Apiosordaria backusii TaxID=314023 RepID=A0AA40K3S4_9PEZI|nr:hypothetical protein B0T21DRAFT_345001 [Apiosordaria backusii]